MEILFFGITDPHRNDHHFIMNDHPMVLVSDDEDLIGGFRNEYGNLTFLYAKKYAVKTKYIDFGIKTGVSYGYNDSQINLNWNKVTPFAAAYLQTKGNIFFNFSVHHRASILSIGVKLK